jgi:hypothetical protein
MNNQHIIMPMRKEMGYRNTLQPLCCHAACKCWPPLLLANADDPRCVGHGVHHKFKGTSHLALPELTRRMVIDLFCFNSMMGLDRYILVFWLPVLLQKLSLFACYLIRQT